MMKANLKTLLLALFLSFAASPLNAAESSPEQAHRGTQPPDAGQLQGEIERQELTRNLSDQVSQMARREPDQPYEVIDGGITLPVGELKTEDRRQ
ncbi:MAG: hypothetical protein LBQ81_09300 [Zoogloeaceae bacterium]|jgi:hypothetical protein|nr:hypothetical protein [Zoogloeaceae bacterium]